MIHCSWLVDALRSLTSDGTATLRIVLSRVITRRLPQSTRREIHRRWWSCCSFMRLPTIPTRRCFGIHLFRIVTGITPDPGCLTVLSPCTDAGFTHDPYLEGMAPRRRPHPAARSRAIVASLSV